MSDYGDYSDDDFEYEGLVDDEYTYVDDGYHIADDLAERSIPSPPPFDDDDEWYDWDRYDYWHEYEDGSCGYFDYALRRKPKLDDSSKTGEKRKADGLGSASTKKVKLTTGNSAKISPSRPLSPTPTVLWRPQAVRRFDPRPQPFDLAQQKPLNIFKDFDKAANSKRPEKSSKPAIEDEMHEVQSCQSSYEDEEDAQAVDGSDNPSIDPEALRAILQQRLSADAGSHIKGFEHEMLLQYAMRMLSGTEDADDIAGELAENILSINPHDQQEDGSDTGSETPNTGLSAWVSRKVDGLRVNDSTATTSEPDHTLAKESEAGPVQQPEQLRSRKRKAGLDEATQEPQELPQSKRRAPSYAAPTASSKARTTVSAKSGTGKGKRG